jgi:diguanylate cyclase (GGDEF)-like protein
MRILVAEDDDNSRQLLEAVLSGEGHEVASFENGLKALAYLQTQPTDLIISDILMPEMDGYGLCRAVKQNHHLEKIPFIFYTATYTSVQDERFAMSLGASKFLIKPMLMPDLMKEVAAVTQSDNKAGPPKSRGLYRGSPLKLDKQHAERVRAKLDKKLYELNEEKTKLAESEARFRDFAEASAAWFWEADNEYKLNLVTGGPEVLYFSSLIDLAELCHSHSPNDMLKILHAKQNFADYIVKLTLPEQENQQVYLRVSGKAVFASDGSFIGYRGVGRDVTEMIVLNHRVEFLASHDELTGLPNRSLFRQRLEHAVAKAERSGNQVLLVFFDLDNFKIVNDTLGHDAGDELLVQSTKRIKARVRASDVLCRLGGDEFVMVMEGASPQDGHRLVRDIIASFKESFDIKQQRVYCTLSIGVSVYPDDTKDPQTLLVYADLAMYRAKQNGRNDFEFYTSNLNFIAHQWLDMEAGIRQALTNNQFFMVYQPQFDIDTQKLIGMEALLRWRHPERGLIPPLEFIKIAEQSSLINLVGDWVFEETCRQIRAWLDKNLKVPRVSINLSARHLRAESLTTSLTEISAKHNINPKLICIEITEHALLEEVEIVKKNMRAIKDLGFSISLDDFGMGHSSLLTLKRWAVDEVKIDRGFVEGLVNNEDDRVIVKAIAALSDALSLNLIAEGIENQQQVDILKASGCKKVQGYFYSSPVEAKDLQKMLKK